MRGEYNMQISSRRKGGLSIRITNLKTEKTSKFIATDKSILSGKYFYYLFSNTILKTLKNDKSRIMESAKD
tara:strand:+ start:139 stop:351 length:213 start_codon:yes stop_codon:yes gene_type:complete